MVMEVSGEKVDRVAMITDGIWGVRKKVSRVTPACAATHGRAFAEMHEQANPSDLANVWALRLAILQLYLFASSSCR